MNLRHPDPSSFWPRAGVWVVIAFLGAGGFTIVISRVTPHPTLVELLGAAGVLSLSCIGMGLFLLESLALMREVRDKRDAAIAARRTARSDEGER